MSRSGGGPAGDGLDHYHNLSLRILRVAMGCFPGLEPFRAARRQGRV